MDTSRNVQIRNIPVLGVGGDVAGKTGYDLTAAGSGTLFLEDVCIGSVYVKDKVVLASQLNLEEDARAGGTPRQEVYNDGGLGSVSSGTQKPGWAAVCAQDERRKVRKR